jgi:hypothetical protein
MKTLTAITLAAISWTVSPLSGGSIQTDSVSADAKWLLHLNLDAFRGTSIGSLVYDSVIKPRADETPIGFRIKTEDIYAGIHAITAYGNTYRMETDTVGVLLARMEPNLISILEAALIQQSAAGTGETDEGENPDINTIQTDPYPVYTMKNELYAAFLPGNTVVFGKSLDPLVSAVDVVQDRAPGLDQSNSGFADMAKAIGSFFFLATAEGFNQSDALPAQARVLQLAKTARLVLGEKTDDLHLALTLEAENQTMRDQLAKIIQGLLALVSLSQVDNHDLAELAQSSQVDTRGNEVTVAIDYPIERVMQLVQTASRDHTNHHHHHESEPAEEPIDTAH